jgi:hypothetical protein
MKKKTFKSVNHKKIIANTISEACKKVCRNITTDPGANVNEKWDWMKWIEPVALKISKECDYSEITLTLDILERATVLNLGSQNFNEPEEVTEYET